VEEGGGKDRWPGGEEGRRKTEKLPHRCCRRRTQGGGRARASVGNVPQRCPLAAPPVLEAPEEEEGRRGGRRSTGRIGENEENNMEYHIHG